MKRWRMATLVVATTLVVVAAFVAGRRTGYASGRRRCAADLFVKQAARVTTELSRLRRGQQVTTIDQRERDLQSLLRGIANNTTPDELAANPLMDAMHWVKRYREMFPCPLDVTWSPTNLPFMQPFEHAQVQEFLEALPPPDQFTQKRLDEGFRELQSAPRELTR